jgi:alpha-mannosidase
MKFRFDTFVAAVAFLLLPSLPGLGEPAEQAKTLWRIGSFNASSGEFRSQDIDYADPKSDLVYVVGKSSDHDWLRFQPGPANGMTGGREHPFTIQFELSDAPGGIYRLKLAMLYETPRLSHLRVSINGHSGLFYFHPKLEYSAGDWEGTFVPQTSVNTKTIEIPAAWMKASANSIVLTALDDPATAQTSLGAIAPGHTGLVYDALELVNDRAGQYDSTVFKAFVEPTIFYQKGQDGLREVVDVFADFATLPAEGELELAVGGHTSRQAVPPKGSEEFGERRLSFAVPQWSGKAPCTVTLAGTGKARTVKVELTSAKKWTVLIVPHEHLDVGFTDYAAKVAELHSQSIDDAMSIQGKTPDFRWTLDGSWVASQYLAGRSKEATDRFLDSVRSGKVVIPPEFANQHTGNASLEGLIRTFYPSHQLARKYDLPRPAAAQTVDVPSYTWAFASVLHDAGIKYFVGASNSWRAPVMLLGRWNEKSPFYWEGPNGGRVLMWYSRAYLQMHTLFGSPWRMESVHDALPVFLQAYTRPDYFANSVLIFGSQLENTPLAKEQAELPAAWNAQYSYPHLEFATVESAMRQIEKEADSQFPVVRGDFGPYWEDGYGSDAKYTALHRENQERILSAEKLSVLPSVLSPNLRPDLSLLDAAWANELTYDEHTWTYVGATSQPEHEQSENQIALKRSRVVEAKRQIDESVQRSVAQLAGLLFPQQDSLAVFNALSWKRNGMVELDLPNGTQILDNMTRQKVAFDVLFVGKGIALPGFGTGYRRVRFEAKDVPAVGYKLYSLQASKEAEAVSKADSKPEVVENQYYRVTLDPAAGAIAGILDKQLGKELVDRKSPYKFGSYLYVTGGDDIPNNSLYRFGAGLNPPSLTVHPAANGKVSGIRRTPFGTVITMESSCVNTPSIRTEVLLYDDQKKIEFRYDLHKDRVLTRESGYMAFPLDISNASFRYGNQIGWVNPAKDELPGGSREWYVARHWTSVAGSNAAVTLVPVDAPLVAFGDIVRGNWPAEFQPKSSAIFSWLMNNYWGTNFPAWQGGDYTFRYVLTSGMSVDPQEAERFGTEAMTPLETTQVPRGTGESKLPLSEAGLLQIDSAGVNLSTWKIAEDGEGLVLRLQETAGRASRVRIQSRYFGFVRAWVASELEDKISSLAVKDSAIEVPLQPFQTVTLRVETSPAILQPKN